MAGEGAMSHAIQSLKFNRSQKRSQRKEKLDWSNYTSNENEVGYDPIKATPELLEEIRTRLQKENKQQKKQLIVFIGISALISVALFYIISR
ncbi:hypothetical protein [Flavobacterium haoranii]|uniref:Uncharacterized protein n=1 Tax=Flavobacterium haoranii TaxID=683124 RepID=A0A1M6BH99_9FLAO|nr:hypothetical protein [Flavobacterium haoranii]SHI48091.1 hypothetical protein SAMN05444337_0107 [Flavobacterium haoranii]